MTMITVSDNGRPRILFDPDEFLDWSDLEFDTATPPPPFDINKWLHVFSLILLAAALLVDLLA
jgi:hypothetical protein